MQQAEARITDVYDVAADKASLEGRVIDSESTAYSVKLSGACDDRWTRTFQMVQLESTGLLRYLLDTRERRITFRVRPTDGAARVILLLERLDRLIEDVNRSAGSWGTGEARG